MALRSAQDGFGTVGDKDLIARMRDRLIAMSAPLAQVILARLLAGADPFQDAEFDRSLASLAEKENVNEMDTTGSIGARLGRSLALQFRRDREWNEARKRRWSDRLRRQGRVGNLTGSFAPEAPSEIRLGRVGSTAVNALQLMTDRCYGRVFAARHARRD